MSVLIKQEIEAVINYLDQFLPFLNCCMVEYFTKSLFKTFIPKPIVEEISLASENDILSKIFDHQFNDDTKSLLQFLNETRKFSLHNSKARLSLDDFKAHLHSWGCDEIVEYKLKMFMNPKKSHEVEIMSSIAAALQTAAKTTHIVDVGDGRGYLSSTLALHHHVPVLGIDSSEIHTDSAIKRLKQVQKFWKRDSEHSNLYKQTTLFVDETTNFPELIHNIFLEKTRQLGLVGLHTCGNLAANSLKLFNKIDEIKTVCNVGCCYHLITEQFEECSEDIGFPMSEFLKERNFTLGRNARMLAVQSIDRILHKKELTISTVFYRAVLQVFLEKHGLIEGDERKPVGKFKKECKSFAEYVRKALKIMKIEIDTSDNELEDFYKTFENKRMEMNIFNLLRCSLAPVVECLILLDRLLFLHEQGHVNAFLVQLFDPVISPRCYGIIAIKSSSLIH